MMFEPRIDASLLERIDLLRQHGYSRQAGPWRLKFENHSGLDRLESAIHDVVAAMGEEAEIIIPAVEFIGVLAEPLEENFMTHGLFTQAWSEKQAVVLMDSLALTELQDDGVRFVVAHELRHVWQHAVRFEDSASMKAHVYFMNKNLILEQDADDYARNLGFVMGESLRPAVMARALGLPEDISFRTVAKAWDTLTPEKKDRLAEFMSSHAAGWRELSNAISGDARLFSLANLWDSLENSERDKIYRFAKNAFESRQDYVVNEERVND
jgi:hypothetical protein